MKRKFVAIVESVPHCYHGGGGITAYAAIQAMHEAGHQVSIIALQSSPFSGGKTETEHVEHLNSLGIHTEILGSHEKVVESNSFLRFARGLNLNRSQLFSGFQQREKIEKLLKKWEPDAVFMYHWNALAATYGITWVPKFGAVGDPAHLPQLFRRQILADYNDAEFFLLRLIKNIKNALVAMRLKKLMKVILMNCDMRGAFAAHHAKMFEEMGVNPCIYLHTPVPDPLIFRKKLSLDGKKFKILHIGHLHGVATMSGVELLANQILPFLLNTLPPNSFEVHIVGGFFDSIPHLLKQRLAHPCVKIRGQISPPDDEFLSSHVVLVPTPIELGIRVRIISAFSYGSCIIAHEANKMGIPEMRHMENCLIGRDGTHLGRLCLDIYKNNGLREELERESRKTYETYFSINSAGASICRVMEEVGLNLR